MNADAVDGRFSSMLSRAALLRLKSKAFRSGAWFRVLKSAERALVDATIRVIDQVRSSVLANALLSVVGKLLDASKSRVEIAVREFGQPYARRLSSLAQLNEPAGSLMMTRSPPPKIIRNKASSHFA